MESAANPSSRHFRTQSAPTTNTPVDVEPLPSKFLTRTSAGVGAEVVPTGSSPPVSRSAVPIGTVATNRSRAAFRALRLQRRARTCRTRLALTDSCSLNVVMLCSLLITSIYGLGPLSTRRSHRIAGTVVAARRSTMEASRCPDPVIASPCKRARPADDRTTGSPGSTCTPNSSSTTRSSAQQRRLWTRLPSNRHLDHVTLGEGFSELPLPSTKQACASVGNRRAGRTWVR